MFDRAHDQRVRAAAFEWLAAQVDLHGDVLPRTLLAQGFEYQGARVPMLGPQGIFKPAVLEVPISLTTSPNGPYNDGFGPGGLLAYRYRGTDPQHRDNRGVRTAWRERLPLVHFHGLMPGRYMASWPVFVVNDNPGALTFSVQVDDAAHAFGAAPADSMVAEGAGARREYVTALSRRRLHQRAFRERVLQAYRNQCALCRLKHRELLDAAHIAPDSDPEGEPVVNNGLALCRLHHSVFDRFFVGIRPDYIIEVRRDLLHEEDGPTLRHAIQALHGQRISVPRREEQRPSVLLLEARYERFLEAGGR